MELSWALWLPATSVGDITQDVFKKETKRYTDLTVTSLLAKGAGRKVDWVRQMEEYND